MFVEIYLKLSFNLNLKFIIAQKQQQSKLESPQYAAHSDYMPCTLEWHCSQEISVQADSKPKHNLANVGFHSLINKLWAFRTEKVFGRELKGLQEPKVSPAPFDSSSLDFHDSKLENRHR